jgi:cell division septum initiation protein DivIVA
MDRLSEVPGFQTEWTPDEIKAQNFRGSLFGFNKREVRDFLRVVSKLWVRMLDHQKILGERIVALEKEVAGWQMREKELLEQKQNALLESQAILDRSRTEAEKMLAETEEKAGSIRKRTEGWLEEVIAKVEETQRQKKNFLTAFRSALDSHYELIKTEEDEAEPLTAKLSDVLRGNPTGNSLN